MVSAHDVHPQALAEECAKKVLNLDPFLGGWFAKFVLEIAQKNDALGTGRFY